MHDRLKSIRAIAKALKLRLPFEPSNDNLHDLIDAIVLLCDEQDTQPKKEGGIQWSMNPEIMNDKTGDSKVTAYLLNGNWHTVGIPKRQPFHEQVLWAANKGAEKIKVLADGQETKVLISQYSTQ